ncbi:MAG TPA: alpha-L-rhamnosidase C-terminal domain-containing protein [Bryobacteraceae bacterium]|jgi:hypothetical protein|nr:alpha-L-rhamnosidase C-terminal domain-containing protein [Bryobacteraceae bacterium]
MRRILGGFLLLAATVLGAANEEALTQVWRAYWIDAPGISGQEYGVYHFRRAFELSSVPEHLSVYVSGDNRFQLFVNGVRAAAGPARGDLTHWRYQAIDLAPYLRPGQNVLAAVVWNDGDFRAVAQISNRTAFLLQAADPAYNVVNTNSSWKCILDKAYTPQPLPRDQQTGYYALAANEHLDSALYPWGWERPAFDDSSWSAAREITHAAPRDARDAPNRWMLVQSQIPPEEQKAERLASIREVENVVAASGFLTGREPVTIPAHTHARLLLDQSYLTTAYPELEISAGRGASIRLHYAEALYSRDSSGKHWIKTNRNDVVGKTLLGPFDTFVSDGGAHRVYSPLFWRTYRYLQLEIETADEPLKLEDLRSRFTAYPFARTANFAAIHDQTNGELQRILDTGWRTARLCAHETYMDCPFYEQLQYAGDARIQMLVSLYMTGDARLMKNGIALLNSSRTAEGATYSRAPSNLQQYIPPFSLWWIGMVHDYWMYVDDPQFVKQMLPGVRAVLAFFAAHQKQNGSLGRLPWWNFVDWVKRWANGEPPSDPDGTSAAALDLQLLLAYGWAADLEHEFGSAALGSEYAQAAERLRASIRALDWDESIGLFADQPSHQTYSQQVNTLAILAHAVPTGRERDVMQRILSDTHLAQSSIYFRAYTNAALRETGLGDRYLEQLDPWRAMLRDGLTTWSEWNGPDTRSDCHAWGASPNFELLRTVAGIEPAAPGFRKVRVAPNLGSLQSISASMPHPYGVIRVEFTREPDRLRGAIELPPGTSGEFDWGGKRVPIRAGVNRVFSMNPPASSH